MKLLTLGVGLWKRREWLAFQDRNVDLLQRVWSMAYEVSPGLAAGVPFRGEREDGIFVRPLLRHISHTRQVKMVLMLEEVGVALVLFQQPTKRRERELALQHSTERDIVHISPLTPRWLRGCSLKSNGRHKLNTPEDGYYQVAIGPLLPSSR